MAGMWKSKTILHQAVSIGNTEFSEVLLRNNADPTIKDMNSENPIDVATCDMFELVKESVKMDKKLYEHLYNDPLNMIFYFAVKLGQVGFVSQMIQERFDNVNVPTKFGEVPFIFAKETRII